MDWEKKSIDLGVDEWRFKDSSYCYSSEESANKNKERHKEKGKPFHTDTTKTIHDVLKEIRVLEKPYTENPGDDDATGPWEDYASTIFGGDSYNKWPDTEFRVYVVFGGSEGIYLHIDEMTPNGAKGLVLMKTLAMGAEPWKKCWESAMRIAWYLSWHVN